MLPDMFTKAWNRIDSFMVASKELIEIINDEKKLVPGECIKTILNDDCVILIGSSKGNIIIYRNDKEVYIKPVKKCNNLKKPAIDNLIYTKLNTIIKSKEN